MGLNLKKPLKKINLYTIDIYKNKDLMAKELDIIPITKIFSIINSCNNHSQLASCYKITDLYVKMAEVKGIINLYLIKEMLHIRIHEKKTELEMADEFKGTIKSCVRKGKNMEHVLAEKFV